MACFGLRVLEESWFNEGVCYRDASVDETWINRNRVLRINLVPSRTRSRSRSFLETYIGVVECLKKKTTIDYSNALRRGKTAQQPRSFT